MNIAVVSRPVAVTGLVAVLLVGSAHPADARLRPLPPGGTAAVSTVLPHPCFMGHHGWHDATVGPPPVC